MLKRTFIHLDGVGPRREADFWRQGVGTWDNFLGAPRLSGLSWERFRRLQEEVRESVRQAADPAYFAARLAAGEHWRLFRAFKPRVGYLDIETTGAYWPGLSVTVVGLYDGSGLQQLVQGRNLSQFPQALADFDLLVTFNGTQFDLPVLRAFFPDLVFRPCTWTCAFSWPAWATGGASRRSNPASASGGPERWTAWTATWR